MAQQSFGQSEGDHRSDDKVTEVDKRSPTSSSPTDVPILIDKQTRQEVVEQIPWRYKLSAGLMIILFAFGSSLSESTFGPLKSTLVEELGITSEQPV